MDWIKIALAGVLFLGLFGVFYAIHSHEEHACTARGGNYGVVGYAPYISGKSVGVSPVYGCQMPPAVVVVPAGK